MSIELIGIYLFACLLSAATPGPGTLSVINYSFNVGFRRTLPVIAGIQLGLGMVAVLALSGIAAFLTAWPCVFLIVQYAGAIYLGYLGYLCLRYAASSVDFNSTAANPKEGFRHGAIVTFASPKSLLFFTSFFPLFVEPGRSLLSQYVVLVFLLLLSTFVVHLSYALSIAWLRGRFSKISYPLNIVSGLVYLGFSAYIMLSPHNQCVSILT